MSNAHSGHDGRPKRHHGHAGRLGLALALALLLVLGAPGTLYAAAGDLDTTFDPPGGANGPVSAIAPQPDGKVLIGGAFTEVNGTARTNIARLNADGTLDTTFTAGANDLVYAIVPQPHGKVLIGGFFTQVDGTTRNGIARLNADGTLDTTFTAGANSAVSAIAPQPDGKVLIGGAFTEVNGTTRNGIARLGVVDPPTKTATASPTTPPTNTATATPTSTPTTTPTPTATTPPVTPTAIATPTPPTITHSAAVQVISAPPSVVESQLESDQYLRVFTERQNYTLPQAITVPGTVIPAGTRVHIFSIHADKVGDDNSRALQLSGWVSFDTQVLAVISDGATLLNTHATLGSAATTYSTRADQGIEYGDSVTRSGQKQVNVAVSLWNGSDNVRVVTLAP